MIWWTLLIEYNLKDCSNFGILLLKLGLVLCVIIRNTCYFQIVLYYRLKYMLMDNC